ncbi:MAG TPA: sialate O-acetylesterase, partial [Algoriphagus sp.]|nr:sialate O-acetylesterase [Algoriphagus sp.]
QNFPKVESKPLNLPEKKYLWVFILAGQSNMAGRGLVEPKDTIPNERILTINQSGELILAKEPLHFYEPTMTGLDCGLSFGKHLLRHVPDSVSILLIPTAVGGSSISQWINDSTYRNVTLFKNFSEKAKIGSEYGKVKGIIWLQGESDAGQKETIDAYGSQLKVLMSKFRNEVGDMTLPIVIGELGSFSKTDSNWQAINQQIRDYAASDPNAYLISTKDLKDKGDKIHFNSAGQRKIGKRFAMEFKKILE